MRFSGWRKMVYSVCALFLVFELAGCESLGRKFVRKPKAEDKKTEEVVFVPEEYKGEGVSNHDLYKQYFLFWRTWQDEFIDSLEPNGSRKKQLDSLDEGIKNLENIRLLLKPEAASRLDKHIQSLKSLRGEVVKDFYLNNVVNNRRRADRIKKDIFKDFTFAKIRDSIL